LNKQESGHSQGDTEKFLCELFAGMGLSGKRRAITFFQGKKGAKMAKKVPSMRGEITILSEGGKLPYGKKKKRTAPAVREKSRQRDENAEGKN